MANIQLTLNTHTEGGEPPKERRPEGKEAGVSVLAKLHRDAWRRNGKMLIQSIFYERIGRQKLLQTACTAQQSWLFKLLFWAHLTRKQDVFACFEVFCTDSDLL